ncbi:MAG: hypothetical protein JWO05_674 [Gemmatimonadetes bacterium]|nr:hypothetical protein [Gemmatimonadota bacterium]
MAAPRAPRRDPAADEYYYRRNLGMRELLPAIGIAVGAGVAAFYVARILLQRTPLAPERRPKSERLPSSVPSTGPGSSEA